MAQATDPPRPEDTFERAVGVESEVGSTAGEAHVDVLIRTLGHERGMDLAIRGGPPPVRQKKR